MSRVCSLAESLNVLNPAMTMVDDGAAEKLLGGNWPLLDILDLAWNRLCNHWKDDSGHLAVAFEALEPRILLDPAAISHFKHLPGQLELLDIGQNEITAECMKVLSQGNWATSRASELPWWLP